MYVRLAAFDNFFHPCIIPISFGLIKEPSGNLQGGPSCKGIIWSKYCRSFSQNECDDAPESAFTQ